MALNVPVLNGSLVDMTMFTQKPITRTAVNEVVRTGIDAKFAKYVEYVHDPIVSSDVKLSPYSSTFDSLATTQLGAPGEVHCLVRQRLGLCPPCRRSH